MLTSATAPRRASRTLSGLSVASGLGPSDCFLAQAEELPTRAEVVSLAQQNQAAFRSLRVKYSCELRDQEGLRIFQLQGAEDEEARAAKPGVAAAQREESLRNASNWRGMAKAFQPHTENWVRDVWRQGEAIQLRWPQSGGLPTVPLTRESLGREFKGISLWSRPSREASWSSVLLVGQKPAVSIQTTLPPIPLLIPPLMVGSAVEEQFLHPLDKVFADGADSISVIGRERIGDVNTLLVEKSSIISQMKDPTDQSNRMSVYVLRAWVDLERGAIPVRVASEARGFRDGKRVVDPKFGGSDWPPSVVDVVIEQVPGGGYYPTKGLYRAWTAARPTESAEKSDGQTPKSVPLLLQEISWSAEVSIPDEYPEFDLMKLAPADSLVFNTPAQQIMVKDDQGELVRAKTDQLIVRTSSVSRWWWLLGGLALIVFALFSVRWLSSRRG